MKKNNLTRGAFAVLLLASAAASADQKYPAADFQPEVLYQDSAYIAKNSPAATATKAAPAAAPKAAVNDTASHEVDSKFPAADFQPEVLYHDPNYKPSASVKVATSKHEVASSPVEAVSEAAAPKEESSLSSYLIGIVVLGLAGFFLKKRSAAPAQKKAPAAAAPATPSYALTTGVAKYLNKVSGTGVSRYLEKSVKTSSVATGVAKYLAKQTVASKTTAAKSATGVEKYMRDRG